jgi:Tfp pilus assembly protein FimT
MSVDVRRKRGGERAHLSLTARVVRKQSVCTELKMKQQLARIAAVFAAGCTSANELAARSNTGWSHGKSIGGAGCAPGGSDSDAVDTGQNLDSFTGQVVAYDVRCVSQVLGMTHSKQEQTFDVQFTGIWTSRSTDER